MYIIRKKVNFTGTEGQYCFILSDYSAENAETEQTLNFFVALRTKRSGKQKKAISFNKAQGITEN